MEQLNLIQYFKYNGLSICSLLFYVFILATSVSNFKDEDGNMNYAMIFCLVFYVISILLEIFLPYCFKFNFFDTGNVYKTYNVFVIYTSLLLLYLSNKYTKFIKVKNNAFFYILYLLIMGGFAVAFYFLPIDGSTLPCTGLAKKTAEIFTIIIDTFLFLIVFVSKKKDKNFVGILPSIYVLIAYVVLSYIISKLNLVVFRPTLFITLIFYHFILVFENRDTEYNQRLVSNIKDTTLINDAKRAFTEKFMSSIKTPMHNIVGLCSILKEDNLENELDENVKVIIKANAVLNDKIEEVSEINNIIKGKTIIDEKEYNLKELVDKLETNLNKQVNNNKSFKVISNDDLNINIVGDSGKIYKSLYFLISLAIENTLEGEITLDIRLSLNKNVYSINIKVSNPGNKINENIFNKKFIDFANPNENVFDIKEELLIAKYYSDILLSPIKMVNNEDNTEYSMSIDQLVVNRGE